MTLVLLLVVVVLAAAGSGAVAVVRAGKRDYAAANEVVPGAPTTAPAAWAGAHTPEALLHRRLRDAVAAVRANPAMEDAWAVESRVSLEQQARAVDERLIAVAALPATVRDRPMAGVAAAVDAVEAAVAALVTDVPAPGRRSGVDQAMADVQRQVAQLAEG